jgi:hypothetical protein
MLSARNLRSERPSIGCLPVQIAPVCLAVSRSNLKTDGLVANQN